ncbi:MAG: filamentous hemagglutinin N-terminal domain-containing protein [Parvibaculum sp.]|uniref:two-partner secretion domain-containing protein n=1 Tax=Parvibaculum sp. TaxID=2024848 RepID=UPI0025FE0AAC|nr:filamentous hemagglutinin N-terminal domain-containing protein [Parvibaculum sp.]MCE9650790.1 filamentous hemagglutinin N-terminal domain-containing protein [Parvibaculum sp.]
MSKQRKFQLLASTALTRRAAAVSAFGLAFGANPAFALDQNALPQGGTVVGGSASITVSGPATLNVNQTSNRTVIDWRSFDIGSSATTNFVQPGSSSIAVNRVNTSANPTQIQGHLNANGQVWILNPNGVLFGKTAKIDVAGLVASTANIDVNRFMSGDTRLKLTGGEGGSVTNEGSITIADSGLAAFVAPAVRNSGTITARVGKVSLAAGTTFTLDLAGDDLVEIGLGANNAIVDHSGKIVAEGGTVQLTAGAASALVDSVVNVSGAVLASSAHEEGGDIVLTADNITTTGSAVLKADAGTNGDGGTIYGYADKVGKYDGIFSAQGGSQSGNGGFIETSGKKVQIAENISVNTLADHGTTGTWTVDPVDLVIGASEAAAIVGNLNTTNQTFTAENSVSVNAAIDSSAQSSSTTLAFNDENADDDLTINLNDKITLGANQHLTGQGTTVNVSNNGKIQNGVDVAATGGATVNVAAGTYNQTVTVNKNGITLAGETGTKIVVPSVDQTNAVDVWANDFTITGFEIAGPAADESYLTYNWGGTVTRGVVIHNGATNFEISGNNIHGLRNNILIDGRNTGSVTNNIIDNSKSGISVQYTDAGAGNSEGYTVTISGNSEGDYGNEWGLNTHLNGHYVGATYYNNAQKIAANATTPVQQALLDNSAANDGWSVQDQGYSNSNRTSVVVSTTGSDANQGSALATLATIQAGINAVVSGGTVNVKNGTYVVSSGYISIGKSLNLSGESEAGTFIDAHAASSYGIRVIGGTSDVNLSDFTLYGVVASGGYGIKVEDSQNVNITNVTSKGAYKAQVDLNGLRGGTLDNVTADGSPSAWGSGSQRGAAIAITDSQNILVKNSSTNDGSYGGLAIYQSNKPSGYSYQTKNITIEDSNTFAESNPVYMEDESATNNFGSVTVEGFDYIAGNTNPADAYTWFQKTQQGAIDAAADASGYVQGWTGTAGNNIFTVGYNTAHTIALTVNAAVNAATTGATINVLSGIYNQAVSITKGLTLQGTEADDRPEFTNGILLSGSFSNLTLKNLSVSGNAGGGFVIQGGGITNLTVDNVKLDGGSVLGRNGFGSGQYGGDISITNSQFVNFAGGVGNTGWVLFDTRSGAGSTLGQDGTVITSGVFSNNLIDNAKGQVNFRQASSTVGTPLTYPDIVISGNTVTNVGSATNSFGSVFKVFRANTVDFSDNNVSGVGTSGFNPAGEAAYGSVLMVRDVTTLNVTDNVFTDNNQVFAVEPGRALPGTTNFSGNTFTNNGYVIYTPTNVVAGGTINFTGTNNIVAGANTVQDIVWRSSDALDLTNVQFGGKLGSGMTQAELFAVEDLITHGTDSASAGLATVKAGNVYVTTNSGSIQRGIDKATAGNTVNVAAGTYDNTLNITKNLDIVGAGVGQTIVLPTTLLTTGVAHKYDANMKVAVFVNGASDVNLSGMTIDGNELGGNAVVFWNNASGSLSDVRITNPRPFNGAQTGQGLAVDATAGHTVNLTVSDAAFDNWNKNGIDVVTGQGATTGGGNVNLTVRDSTFTGGGATDTIAQNGILLWERGGGTVHATVDGSSFSDISYTDDDAVSSGILVYGSPNGTLTVSNSSFDGVQKYIALDGGSPNEVDATEGNTFDGVEASSATLAQLFAIEDHLQHKLDDAANGLVRIVEGAVFVTADKGNINAGIAAASTGDTVNVQGGTYAEDVVVNVARNFTFSGSVLNSFTANVATKVGGTVTALNGFALNAVTLLSNTVFNGALTASSINGSTAGGQTLAVNAGAGHVGIGSLGASTRLGAVSVSGGSTTLTGGTYAANGLSFTGPVTLTQSLTTFNTTISPSAAGNIVFNGDLFGTVDSAQSVSFIAGPGTGAASANGDITLQNAGTDAIWLGSMGVSGRNLSAKTVYVGGSYNASLVGNQTFSSETLNTKGSVTSTVGGNATGPINSGGNVNLTAGGGINGNITAPTATLTGQTITGTMTGGTFNLFASSGVDVNVNVDTVNVTSPSGTVDGTYSTLNSGGSGTLVVNGSTRTGDFSANPNQIVIEGYTLPAGSYITASGEIVLPEGMVIGLISPQAGPGAKGSKPKVIVVHSVRRLGELLAQGYTAIIVDLSKTSDEEEVIALAD